jgi:hypothetical protein
MKFYKIPFKALKPLINKVFPKYKGRKLFLVVHDSNSFFLTHTYWDGGQRSYFAGLNLESGQFGHLQGVDVHPFDSQVENKEIPLTSNLAVLEHRYSGTHQWIWLHIHRSVLSQKGFSDLTLIEC